jgi:hypothetical protein
VSDPPADAGYLRTRLYGGLQRALWPFSIDRTCESCGGTGSVERTRERHLEELTDKQIDFLYEAQIERKKAENGTEEDIEGAKQDVDVPTPSGNVPNVSGSPPANGNIRKL